MLLSAGLTADQSDAKSATVQVGPAAVEAKSEVSGDLLDVLAQNAVEAKAEGEAGSVNTDTNGDGKTTPVDALRVIALLNNEGPGPVDESRPSWGDVSGDENVSPFDVLLVILAVNRQAQQETPVGSYSVWTESSMPYNGPLTVPAGDIVRSLVFTLPPLTAPKPSLGSISLKVTGDWRAVESIFQYEGRIGAGPRIEVTGPVVEIPVNQSSVWTGSFAYMVVTKPGATGQFGIETDHARRPSGGLIQLVRDPALAEMHPWSAGPYTVVANPKQPVDVVCNTTGTCTVTTDRALTSYGLDYSYTGTASSAQVLLNGSPVQGYVFGFRVGDVELMSDIESPLVIPAGTSTLSICVPGATSVSMRWLSVWENGDGIGTYTGYKLTLV
jgi:hypothetical protein